MGDYLLDHDGTHMAGLLHRLMDVRRHRVLQRAQTRHRPAAVLLLLSRMRLWRCMLIFYLIIVLGVWGHPDIGGIVTYIVLTGITATAAVMLHQKKAQWNVPVGVQPVRPAVLCFVHALASLARCPVGALRCSNRALLLLALPPAPPAPL